jgi:dTDP-4-dehydrorhamnose reductase
VNNRRVLIVGAAGQVGKELQRSFQDFGDVVAVDRESVNLESADEARELVLKARPDVILNAAAYTAVDRAELEPVTVLAINAKAPQVLAEEAKRMGSLLVHYSTDYVFDGTKREPWIEIDPPHPLGVYGKTKLAGEEAIQNVGGDYLIFRTSWVYGPHGSNFLGTMLRLAQQRTELKVVDDQVGAPTTSVELANATRSIVDGVIEGRFGEHQNWAGLYHMTCSGSVSWCGFAQAIFARARTQLQAKVPSVYPISSGEYPVAAQRPLYSVLSNQKLLAKFNLQLPSWEAALDDVFEQIVVDAAKPARQV